MQATSTTLRYRVREGFCGGLKNSVQDERLALPIERLRLQEGGEAAPNLFKPHLGDDNLRLGNPVRGRIVNFVVAAS
jgi:hypothetical protein